MITEELLKSDRLKFKNKLNCAIIEYNEEFTNCIRFTIKTDFYVVSLLGTKIIVTDGIVSLYNRNHNVIDVPIENCDIRLNESPEDAYIEIVCEKMKDRVEEKCL